MTPRGARLAAVTGLLATAAAALSALAPSLPAGLATAVASRLVLPELLAGLAVAALLAAPAFTADEEGRPAEDPASWLCLLAGMPAATALAVEAGRAPGDLLAAGTLLGACALAAGSYLRFDPAGRRGTAWAALAVTLLAALPIAAWGVADLAGWEPAAEAFRFSPLLAARTSVGGTLADVAPAALLLVALSAVLRLAAPARGETSATPSPAEPA